MFITYIIYLFLLITYDKAIMIITLMNIIYYKHNYNELVIKHQFFIS